MVNGNSLRCTICLMLSEGVSACTYAYTYIHVWVHCRTWSYGDNSTTSPASKTCKGSLLAHPQPKGIHPEAHNSIKTTQQNKLLFYLIYRYITLYTHRYGIKAYSYPITSPHRNQGKPPTFSYHSVSKGVFPRPTLEAGFFVYVRWNSKVVKFFISIGH